MANEVFPTNRGYILVKTESTYGSDPTLAAADDAKYIEDWDGQAKDIMEQRAGISPYRPGWRPVRTNKENTFSGAMELTTVAIGASDTVRPEEDEVLLMCGFAAAHASGTPNTLTYTLQSQGGGSAAIEEYFFDEDHADGIGWQFLGCRADWTIEIPAVGKCRIVFNGEAKTGTQLTSSLTPDSNLDYAATCPVVGGTWTVTVTELDGDTAFGGGVIEATISGNMGLQRQQGQSGSVGPATIRLVPSEAIGFSVLFEQVADGDWDPTTMLADCDGSANVFTVSMVSTDASNNDITIAFTCSMTDIEIVADQDGRRCWRIQHSGTYPEDTSDGGGLTPAENLTITYSN